MNAEIIRNMPFEEYIAVDAINASSLKDVVKSPLFYRHRRDEPRKDNDSLRKGRAAHTATLEPERFLREYALYDGKRDKRVKKYQGFLKANAGRTVLNPAEYDEANAIAKSVRSHDRAKRLLAEGESELTILWTHVRTGERCKSRVDWLHPEAVVDLKTTRDPSPALFATDSARLGYDLQFAFYADALAAAGIRLPMKIIAAQSSAPYDVVVYHIGSDTLAVGQSKYEAALDTLLACREENTWPGQAPSDEIELHLPKWATEESLSESTTNTDLGF